MTATNGTRAKLTAYKRHWKEIRRVQDEMSRQYIHEQLRVSEVASEAHLANATVKRFFQFGRGNGKTGYSIFRGPAVTTVFGIASAIDMEIAIKPKNWRNGRS